MEGNDCDGYSLPFKKMSHRTYFFRDSDETQTDSVIYVHFKSFVSETVFFLQKLPFLVRVMLKIPEVIMFQTKLVRISIRSLHLPPEKQAATTMGQSQQTRAGVSLTPTPLILLLEKKKINK